MKKSLLILTIINISNLKSNDLTTTLASLEVSLAALSKLIPKPQKKAISDLKRMEDIKTLFTNYKNNPKERHLNELYNLFIGINEAEYQTMLKKYNDYIDEYKDDEEKITEPELLTIAKFTAWHTNELKIAEIEPSMKKLETIYLNDQFQRIATITTKKVLDQMLDALDEFNNVLNEQKDNITLYPKWSKLIPNPTYESFKDWSNEKKEKIIQQHAQAKKAAFISPKPGTIAQKTYCKFPPGTQITINGKTIIIDKADLSPYQDENGNLLNVQSITVFQEGIKGKLRDIPIKGGKTYKASTAQLEIEWLPKLPKGSGWCE